MVEVQNDNPLPFEPLPFLMSPRPKQYILLAPPYRGTHFVYPASWNYSPEALSGSEMIVSFASGPPRYEDAMKATSTCYAEESLPSTPNDTKTKWYALKNAFRTIRCEKF